MKRKYRIHLFSGLLIASAVLGLLTFVALSVPASASPVNMVLIPPGLCGGTPCSGSTQTQSVSPTHIADTWQEWYDGNTFQQILTTTPSPAWVPQFQQAPVQSPATGFMLRIPVKLFTNLPEGFLMDQGPTGWATCAVSPVPLPLCQFTVLMYSITLTISVNGQVQQTINPGVLGNPTFVSFQDKVGTQKDMDLFVWLVGNTPPAQQAESNFANSLCSGLCSIFNTNLLTNYVDLRSALSGSANSQFTVSVNIVEHYRAFQLTIYSWLTFPVGGLVGNALGQYFGSYLTSPVSTVDVDNGATGPPWFTYTSPTCGTSCLPPGTFTSYTAPTRMVTTDTNGNLVVVVSSTSYCNVGVAGSGCFVERGYTVTVWTNPYQPLQCLLINDQFLLWTLCQSTTILGTTLPNWAWVLLGIVGFIVVIAIIAVLLTRGSTPVKLAKRVISGGGSKTNRSTSNTINVYVAGRKQRRK